MSFQMNNESSVCRSVEPLLSDYMENALSAREIWEVEKHLAVCTACTQLSQQMQATVQVLRGADRYDTADDFMAKLHARLDDLEPEVVSGRSQRDRTQNGLVNLQDWLVTLQARMRTWHLPALTAGFASAVLVLMVHGNLSVGVSKPPTMPAPAPSEAMSRQVAFAASNPFDDPVAAKAEADGDNRTDNSSVNSNF